MQSIPISQIRSDRATLEDEASRKTEPGLLINLNTLRAIAALAVVYSHVTSEAGLNLHPSIGTRGVDIFFVISGFIIAYIGSRNADRFFIRRLIRIVPFYWAATLAVFVMALMAPTLLRSTRADPLQLLCSLFFIPRHTNYADMAPTLVLGWSLNYEMYFYVVFSLCLLLSRRLAPILCCLAIAAILRVIDASGTTNPSIQFYARPLVFEFVFGIVAFYLLYAVERHRASWQSIPFGKYILLALLLASLIIVFFIESKRGFGLPRVISSGIPAFVIVLSALLLERIYRLTIDNRILFLLGEASYILYLIHPYIVFGLLRTVLRGARYSLLANIAIIIFLMTAASVVAVAIHLLFEKPVMRLLRRQILGEGLPRADERSRSH
ncbi:MAG TPA: acyltransferase [Rhodanobacter sp.]|nr:acyltransferase [Rhodanobacter sp.]